MNITRERLGRALTVAGMAAGVPSVQQTASHVLDEDYRVAGLPEGERHIHYHMAREVLITLGCFGVVGIGLAAGAGRSRSLWRTMAVAVGGYAAAMWSGGPVVGTWAPNRAALAVHAASTAGLLGGVALLRPGPRAGRDREKDGRSNG